ncbi:hypothetical protein PF003_g38534 [Phytophthora fragariae]|nr:hypothetical protein PF003_g38534 [Phytophthora fragariae]
MAPGRPRTLPSSLPRLAPEVALDPDLAHVNLQSRQAILRERLKRKRQQRQEQVAEQHARQRSKRKIEELTMVYEKAQLDSEKTEKALEPLERKRAQQKCELEQLRLAVEGGEHEATAPEESQLRRIAGQFYFHVEHFLKFSEDRTPVFTQQLYEPSHRGDDAGLCPMLPETLERLLDSYLPHRYAEFTPKAQPDVEESYGCKRLTMEMIEAIEARQYVGVASDSNTATDASSVTEFNF